MTSPFDDLDFAARLAQSGIVHEPGLADRTLRELAPLLAEEGIDLDDLDESDLDAVNAALARAAERQNLKLFTPLGAHRAQALTLLGDVAEAIAHGDDERGEALLAQIQPDATDNVPSVAHVIGVSLGVLDAWNTDPALRAALAGTRVPQWDKPSRAAATDILALSRKGRAFDAIGSLHRRHSGLAIFRGAVLVVAASLISRAAHEKLPVHQLKDRALGEHSAEVPRAEPVHKGTGNGAAFTRNRKPASAPAGRRATSTDTVSLEFGAWLKGRDTIAAPSISEEVAALEALLALARRASLDLHDPLDIDEFVDLLFEVEDPDQPEVVDSAMAVLHDHVLFRIDTSEDVEHWEEARQIVEEALDERFDEDDPLSLALESGREVAPDVRRDALAQTRIVSAVKELLAWIGDGRQVSPSGGVRRTDIQTVAGMLGVSAVGANKRAPLDAGLASGFGLDAPLPEPPVIHALSMHDVPMLAAWWEALATTDVIETSATRVRRGPAAAAWVSGAVPPHDLAEMVVGVFVMSVLTKQLEQPSVFFEEGVTAEAIRLLLRALAPELAQGDGVETEGLSSLLRPRALSTLRHFRRAGLVHGHEQGEAVVPPPLRVAVARGVILALTMLAGGPDEA